MEAKDTIIKDKIVQDKQKYWDEVAELYDRRIQMISYQPYITLATQTEAYKAKRILELAIGTGTHTLNLSKTMLQRGSALFCTEISPKMLELAEQKFKNQSNDFITIPDNLVQFDQTEAYLDGSLKIDVEQELIKRNFKENQRLVHGIIANNECLPFQDEQFDCYLAPLSLMLVNDYKKQLQESYRVTKKNAKVGFSVWGRKENVQLYSVLEIILDKYGLGPNPKPVKSNYDICRNRDAIKQEMEEMGFINIKMWFEPMNYTFNDFNDFFDTIFGQPTSQSKLKTLDETTLNDLINDAKKEFEEKLQNTTDPNHFENMIIIATKN